MKDQVWQPHKEQEISYNKTNKYINIEVIFLYTIRRNSDMHRSILIIQ